jgi:hypothetical protein
MINIFEMSKRIIEKLNNPTKNYWEKDTIEWNREALAPDGSTYNEQELFEAIRESDKQRLLRYG